MEEQFLDIARKKDIYDNTIKIITSSLIKLKTESRALMEKAFINSHLQYLLRYEKGSSFPDITHIGNAAFSNLNSSTSLSFFKKPSYKERLTHLVSYLISNPIVFSTIIYQAFSNEEAALFGDDSLHYFFSHTIPSIYCFFINFEDQNLAIELIKYLVSYYNDEPSYFNEIIINTCQGFFRCSNPRSFFNYLDIDNLCADIESEINEYSLFNGKLIRKKYWESMLSIAIQSVDNMINCINLLPPQISRLFSALYQENPEISDFLFFNVFLSDFIENVSFLKVIECTYSKSLLFHMMEGIWDLSLFQSKLTKFKQLLRGNPNPIRYIFESEMLVTTRDLTLLLALSNFYIQNFKLLGYEELTNLCFNLSDAFFNISDRIVLELRKWCYLSQFSFSEEMNFVMTSELFLLNPDKGKINTYYRQFLTYHQMIQIDAFNDQVLNQEIKKVETCLKTANLILDQINQSSVYVKELNSVFSRDVKTEVRQLFEKKIGKNFVYLNFRSTFPLYQRVGLFNIIDGIDTLHLKIVKWLKLFKFNKKALNAATRSVFFQFLDFVIARIEFELDLNAEPQLMEKTLLRLNKAERTPAFIQKASKLFTQVSREKPFQSNFTYIMSALFTLKSNFHNSYLLKALALSKNCALFWFGEIAMRILVVKTLRDKILTKNENEAIAYFLSALIEIESQ